MSKSIDKKRVSPGPGVGTGQGFWVDGNILKQDCW